MSADEPIWPAVSSWIPAFVSDPCVGIVNTSYARTSGCGLMILKVFSEQETSKLHEPNAHRIGTSLPE